MKIINLTKKLIQDQSSKIFLIFLAIPAALNFFPIIKTFPDYHAYETMFYTWEKLPNINWGPLYILLNKLTKYIGLNYLEYRIFLYSISAFLITLSFFIIKNNFHKRGYFNFYSLIGILISIEFYLEFLLIRIRAGLGISIATLGICIYITYGNIFLALLLVAISYFVHSFSAVVMACILIPVHLSKIRKDLNFNLTLAFLGVIIIVCAEIASEYRGSGVYSKLNIYRFIAISPITFFVYYFNNKIIVTDKYINNFEYFIGNLIKFYLSLMCGIFISFVFGILKNSGEGLLRIIYIFDIFWIFSLILTESRYRLTISYIASINAIFFIYAVFIR